MLLTRFSLLTENIVYHLIRINSIYVTRRYNPRKRALANNVQWDL
jgi:hypothetical protein